MVHLLNKLVDNIYVLYISQVEFNNIKNKIDNLNLKVEYFKGINGSIGNGYSMYEKWYFKNKYRNMPKLSKGSYGHISSFIRIIEDAMLNSYKKIMIIEPDVYFCENFNEQLKKYVEMIKKSKLMYLGGSQNMFYSETTWDCIDIYDNYYNAYKTLGTFALIIDKNIYKEIIEQCSLMEEPTDVCLTYLQSKYSDECFVAYPNIICCDVTESLTVTGKNQLTTIKQLHWFNNYIFENSYHYTCEGDKLYKIEIYIDSFIKNPSIIISDDVTTMEINKHLFNILVSNNLFVVYFKPANKFIKLNTKNIFTKTPIITRGLKSSFQVHLQRLRYSIKHTKLQKYYSNM